MRRILLCGMENLRDLGGYPLAGRGSERFTRWGSLYRGDLPKQVTQADRQRLRELGITTVVDLRSKEEIERKPDPLAQEPGIRYLHCALAGDGRVPAPDEVPLSYMEMADGTGQMAGALRAIAEAPQAVLFHCTAGKDRTGVVAALLLWLAGVSEEDILADYIVSGPYLQQLLRAYCEAHPGAVVCPPQSAYMSSFLRLFAQRYGTPWQYLEMLGVDAGKLAEKLRPKEL